MDLKPKLKTKMFSSWRDTTDVHDEVHGVQETSGANYTDTMKYLIRKGLRSHRGVKKPPVLPKKESPKKGVPPNFHDVYGYFIGKVKDDIEAEKFYNYYESNGWKVGKNKMKDWKAAARGWISRNQKPGKKGHQNENANQLDEIYEQRRSDSSPVCEDERLVHTQVDFENQKE